MNDIQTLEKSEILLSWDENFQMHENGAYVHILGVVKHEVLEVNDLGNILEGYDIINEIITPFLACTITNHLYGISQPIDFSKKIYLDKFLGY